MNMNAEKKRPWTKKSKEEIEQLVSNISSLNGECASLLRKILELNGDEVLEESVLSPNCKSFEDEVTYEESEFNIRDRFVEQLKSVAELRDKEIESLRIYFRDMQDE